MNEFAQLFSGEIMPLTYEEGLQAQLDADPKFAKTANGRRIANVLAMDNKKRRGRILDRMERHSRVHTGFTGSDWGKVKAVDWKSIFELLIKLLPLLLMLFA